MNLSKCTPSPKLDLVSILQVLSLFISLWLPIYAFGQAAAKQDLEKTEKNPVLQLNPFIVNADDANGYTATNTLAGTRINTDLKDIASSISVYTKVFLQDTGATDLKDLLVYTTGTEVAGVGGNFTNETEGLFSLDFYAQRFAANPSTRVRGLAGADNTRNYFSTIIPLDSYNTDTVTINRGANNILFGLGSPAGIIERSLARPVAKNTNEVVLRTDKYGSLRTSFDFNRVLVKDKLNARLIGLHDWKEVQQKLAYDKNRRLFGALDYKPFKSTLIRVNAEAGDRVGVPEDVSPPRDRLSYWWTKLNQATVGPGYTNQPQPTWTDIAANNRNPVFLQNAAAGTPYAGIISLNDGTGLLGAILKPGTALYNIVPTNLRNDYQPHFNAVDDPTRLARLGSPGVDASDYSRSPQITDPSIFDYNNQTFAGRNDRIWNDFKAYNIAVQQTLFDGDIGFELAYDKQEFNNASYNSIGSGHRDGNIGVDINNTFADGTPNPNVGRPFIITLPSWGETRTELATSRLTAFYKFDAEKKLGGLGKWLGKHTFTGLWDKNQLDSFSIAGYGQSLDTDFGNAIGYRPTENRIDWWLRAQTLYYIGDSMQKRNSPTGLNLPGLPAHVEVPKTVNMLYISTPTRDFKTGTYSSKQYPDNKTELTSAAGISRNKTESMALAWQSKWLSDTLVATLGWRNDKFKSFNAGEAPQNAKGVRDISPDVFKLSDSPKIDTEGDTFSWGMIAHMPNIIAKNLRGTDISLHYGESENFAPGAATRSPLGGYFGPPTGTTKDYGMTFSMLQNRIVARVTKYETTQENLPDSRLTSPYLWYFFQLPQQIYQNNPTSVIEAAGFKLPGQVYQDAYEWKFSTGTNGNKILTGRNIGAGDVVRAVSKGYEIDLTANLTSNWRLSLNAAKQKAVRTGVAQNGLEEVNRLANAWLNNPAALNLKDNNNLSLGFVAERELATLKTALATDGQLANELREWRTNLVTNYTFSKGSRLAGFGYGGAVRYQSKSAIGSEVRKDPQLGFIPDLSKLAWGPNDTKFDVWISYQTKIWKKIGWELQLNVRNVFNEDGLVPVYYNPDGSGYIYSIGKQRDWFLTSSFRF